MALPQDHISMALFCDFENVALGVRDANYDKFDIKRVLERLLLKGSIVVKKAYCDWERYKAFKAPMHEANFELIEIPHVRQSGKNSADIRLVVDALDLCYTKSHVNTFVIISGDSDFSPLVSKLRENAKYVIGVGVKQSTSDLLTANCDEFIFYDDLVRESQRNAARRDNRDAPQPRRTPEEEQRRRAEMDARRTKAVEMAAETYEALVTDRDEGGKIWASVLKEAIKRRNPGFNENYYGFRTFGNLLEEAQARGLLEFGRDEKSSAYVTRGTGVPTTPVRNEVAPQATPSVAPASASSQQAQLAHEVQETDQPHGPADDQADEPQAASRAEGSGDHAQSSGPSGSRRRGGRDRDRGGRNGGRSGARNRPQAQGEAAAGPSATAAPAPVTPIVLHVPTPLPTFVDDAPAAAPAGDKPAAKKTSARRPRKSEASAEGEGQAGTSDQPAGQTAAKSAGRTGGRTAGKTARKTAAKTTASKAAGDDTH
ncbi:MAG: NYN domain-containing protein [Burkholderiales bacterium]|nr:NYN domain-containing protein [Burkholderiales bacterium]